MNRKITQIGVAPPSSVNTRPSGRYAVQAPDAPVGCVLRVKTRDGGLRFVEVMTSVVRSGGGERFFIGVDGKPVMFVEWDYANRAESDMFKFERQVTDLADFVDLRGAPAFGSVLVGSTFDLPDLEVDALVVAVAEELRARGKPGKASQVLTYRPKED